MKKFTSILLTLIMTFAFTACNGGGNSNEQAANDTQTETVQEESTKEAKTKAGDALIQRAVDKLERQLSLSEEQVTSIKSILTENFTSGGNDLAGSFNAEEARTITHDILNNSKEAIDAVLNEEQKVKFGELMNNMK